MAVGNLRTKLGVYSRVAVSRRAERGWIVHHHSAIHLGNLRRQVRQEITSMTQSLTTFFHPTGYEAGSDRFSFSQRARASSSHIRAAPFSNTQLCLSSTSHSRCFSLSERCFIPSQPTISSGKTKMM